MFLRGETAASADGSIIGRLSDSVDIISDSLYGMVTAIMEPNITVIIKIDKIVADQRPHIVDTCFR